MMLKELILREPKSLVKALAKYCHQIALKGLHVKRSASYTVSDSSDGWPTRVEMSGVFDQSEAALQRQVTRLRNCDPTKFRTMCHMHLTFMLDLDGSSFEDFIGEDMTDASRSKKTNFPHFGKKKTNRDKSDVVLSSLTQSAIANIQTMVDFLTRPENICQQGLFRKSGQLSRQRILREKLSRGEHLEEELATNVYTVHDCASLLKSFLAELPEPLLTERHFATYCKIPEMCRNDMSDDLEALMTQRQLATAQLLVQLLPRPNASLLQKILTLLHQVAQTEGNLMTAVTLGTLFAPHLLVPRKVNGADLHQMAHSTMRAVAYMIENAPAIFKVPEPLMRDITAYWRNMEEVTTDVSSECTPCQNTHRYKKRAQPDSEAVHTTVTFVDRQAVQRGSIHIDTQVELAQLYAHINSMPESAKKRKFLKQFNRANGPGTPLHASAAKHTRSKSFGDSIKRMVGRHHKRRGSGHSVQLHSVTPSAAQSSLGRDECPKVIELPCTPIIRAASSTADSPAMASPILRLFKNNIDQPITPSSPRVHIVDLKADDTSSCFCKRRADKCSSRQRRLPAINVYSKNQCHLVENYENIAPSSDFGRWAIRTNNNKSPHAPVVITPDRRFEKASSCVSPITWSMTKAPRHIQKSMQTPGSRRPMSVIQTP